MKTKIALISVYHKDGITEFASRLIALGFEILASGGTAKHLINTGVPVTGIASLVGGKAILGHRVVTLSREIHAGLLARRIDADIQEMEELGLPYIDLVCVDLYPLQEEIDKPDGTAESVIEQTDIGGPTMLRSAAKGRRIVIGDPDDRMNVAEWLDKGSPDEDNFLTVLAAKAEFIVANYCLLSAKYHGRGEYAGFLGKRAITCKYGENGYQTPAYFYQNANAEKDPLGLGKFQWVGGTTPSYNNLRDLHRLLQTITHIAATFDYNYGGVPCIALGVKHGNSCGAAIATDSTEAIKKMVAGDPQALFGGVVMVNFPIDEDIADLLLHYQSENRRLWDGIIAPEFSKEAIELLERKNGKCRLATNNFLYHLDYNSLDQSPLPVYARGGFQLQPNYTFILSFRDIDIIKYGPQISADLEEDLLLAKAICDTSNSNTITIVKNGQLIGNGVGQQSRVQGARLAVSLANLAGHDVRGSVAASDSFFPFEDGPMILKEAGVKVIFATGGSINDKKIIDYCERNGVTLYMMPDSQARGFYAH
ncbi:MAG: hypothetical protein Q8N57_02165 [bacterium]|nr:hypothetical protein [bacterium]